jgi:3(or 17)beta-hydroxysteroid dehydrogenase
VSRVADKIALVTGAADGIGRAAATALAAEGATVYVTDLDAERAACVAGEIGDAAAAFGLDVGEASDWERGMARVLDERGRLDVLVNNAGVFLGKTLADTTLDDLRRLARVNVDGVFLGCKHGVAAMRRSAPHGETARGSIVNVSSFMGLVGLENASAYCATKGAIRVLTKAVAVECGQRGELIRVNSIHPGIVRTAVTESLLPQDAWQQGHRTFARVPMRRWCTPEDVAEGIVFLASEESAFMTAAEMPVDGGYTAA